MQTLSIGIVAHVDAGKTTLTERLLFAAGVIDAVGSVDRGDTQTDTLALERERGITIKSAVVSFMVDDITVNLIDTPGHPDFIAEVERVLSVLDGAVLVVSAVEGVQAQSRVLMRALQRLGIPTLIFVNKIDRRGARHDRVLHDISERLTPVAIAMGSVGREGTRLAVSTSHAEGESVFASRLVELLAEHDDMLLAAYVHDETSVTPGRLRNELASQTQRALIHPVFFGSAITGTGVEQLIEGIKELLPAVEGDIKGPVSARVFEVERGPTREKIAYARILSGTVRVRDRLELPGDRAGKVTAISVFNSGPAVRSESVAAGQIGKLWGLSDIQIGDTIGLSPRAAEEGFFVPPTLESVVVPRRPADKGALHGALVQLTEQDPLLRLRQDDIRGELSVSLYGEVQKEVIQETLSRDFNIDVTFSETKTIHIERPLGSGAALETLGKDPNPFLATIGLRIDPAPIDAGINLELSVDVRSIPLYVYRTVTRFAQAIEETVLKTLQQGLYGWRVTDCIVSITESGYSSPGTGAGDFRLLTPLVVMDALKRAGTTVCEPVHKFRLDGPKDSLRPTMRVLAQLRAQPQAPTISGPWFTLEGEIAAARMHLLQQQMRGLTHGEGMLEFTFDHYQPVSGAIPTRPRSDPNPLNRKEYLLNISGRLTGR